MKLATILHADIATLTLVIGDDLGAKLLPLGACCSAMGNPAPDGLSASDPLLAILASKRGWQDLTRLAALISTNWDNLRNLALDASRAVFLPPVLRPGKILAAGRNYARPGQPAANREAAGPPVFAKFPSTMVGHGQPVRYPVETSRLDYEVELAVIIGRECTRVSADDALGYVAGFTIFNDLTMSDVQRREIETGLILFGKNADDSGPCGPWMVSADEFTDPNNLRLRLEVDGEVRQDDTTASMIFGVQELIAYCSRMTLMPGDLILTGTPSGTAAQIGSQDAFVKPGQTMTCTIEGIGTLQNVVAG